MSLNANPIAIITFSHDAAREIARQRDLTHPRSWRYISDEYQIHSLQNCTIIIQGNVPFTLMTRKFERIWRTASECAKIASRNLKIEYVEI